MVALRGPGAVAQGNRLIRVEYPLGVGHLSGGCWYWGATAGGNTPYYPGLYIQYYWTLNSVPPTTPLAPPPYRSGPY